MERRRFGTLLAAAVGGMLAASNVTASEASPSPVISRHVCKGLNDCKGQGSCAHGCSGHGCSGRNECKGKGGCAASAARHGCAGQNSCKGIGGCASGDKGCAARNSCKGRGGCEVPLKVEHAQARKKGR
jgi:hypothetical protein